VLKLEDNHFMGGILSEIVGYLSTLVELHIQICGLITLPATQHA